MTTSPWIVDVKQDDFERDVLVRTRELPVVVDFWAPWCGPCRALGPILEKLAAERNGDFLLAKVNIDEAQDLAAALGIEAIPAVRAFRDGQEVLGFVGVLPEDQLREFLNRIRPSEADQLVRQATEQEAKAPDAAEALYRHALDQDPNHTAAIVGLARLLMARGEDAEAADLLGHATPGGELGAEMDKLTAVLSVRQLATDLGDESAARKRLDGDPANAQRHYELGCVLAAAGRYQEALDLLLAAAEADRKLASSQVREAMLKIFQIIGVRTELADAYRDKLSRLLY